MDWHSQNFKGEVQTSYEGLLNVMMRRYRQTRSEAQKKDYAKFMSDKPCGACSGKRLSEEALHVKIDEKSIYDLTGIGQYFHDELIERIKTLVSMEKQLENLTKSKQEVER